MQIKVEGDEAVPEVNAYSEVRATYFPWEVLGKTWVPCRGAVPHPASSKRLERNSRHCEGGVLDGLMSPLCFRMF